MNKTTQVGIGIAVSAASMYFALSGVKWSEVAAVAGTVTYWPFLGFLVVWIVHYCLRAWRWRYLLPEAPEGAVSFRALSDSIILGTFASFVLPLRLGEFIRPLILSRWTSYSFASAFASVVIERFFDLSAVLISLAIIIPFLPVLPDEAVVVAYSFGVLACGLFLFMVAGSLLPTPVKKIVHFFLSPLPDKLRSFAMKFCDDLLAGTAVVATLSRLSMTVLLTVVIWATSYAQFYFLYLMMPEPVTLLLTTTTGVLVALAVAAPSAPGFVGVFQAGCVAAAELVQYPLATAQAFSLIAHLGTYLLILVVGFFLMSRHDLSLGELKSAAGRKG